MSRTVNIHNQFIARARIVNHPVAIIFNRNTTCPCTCIINHPVEIKLSAYLVRVAHLELPTVPGPGDEALAGLVRQQLQDELPQLDGTGGRDGRAAAAGVPARVVDPAGHRRLGGGEGRRRRPVNNLNTIHIIIEKFKAFEIHDI